MPGAAVHLEQVSRAYPSGAGPLRALDGVTLEIVPAEALAVTGPSGSGKSTLLHILGAMDRSDSGHVQVDDLALERLGPRELTRYRRTIGFVFQRYHLLPALTALDNVLAPVLPRRTPFDKVARARELLAAVGLGERETALPASMSGGQQQRVAIARALMGNPRLLLADEPTGNLDSVTGAEVLELLLTLRSERGMTLVVVTHDPGVAAACDRVLRLRDGRVVDEVPVQPSDGAEVLDRVQRLA
jgi:putative ABC transport system ATP-binding protein